MFYKSRRWLLLLILGLTFIAILPWFYVHESPAASSSVTFDRPLSTPSDPLPQSGSGTSDNPTKENSTTPAQVPLETSEIKLDNNQEHWNMRQLSELYACVAGERRCHANKRKIILFASPDTKYGLWDGWRRGESIWLVSSRSHVANPGLTGSLHV